LQSVRREAFERRAGVHKSVLVTRRASEREKESKQQRRRASFEEAPSSRNFTTIFRLLLIEDEDVLGK
jgi:hypothetical protein